MVPDSDFFSDLAPVSILLKPFMIVPGAIAACFTQLSLRSECKCKFPYAPCAKINNK